MKYSAIFLCFFACVFVCLFSRQVSSRSIQYPIRSDVIVTKWPEPKPTQDVTEPENKQPGWMRQQLVKFGEVASKVGNIMGGHASKITSAVDKVCEIVKTVIPLLAAVCHVGQFKFCGATEAAPTQLADALAPAVLNLDELDKKK